MITALMGLLSSISTLGMGFMLYRAWQTHERQKRDIHRLRVRVLSQKDVLDDVVDYMRRYHGIEINLTTNTWKSVVEYSDVVRPINPPAIRY